VVSNPHKICLCLARGPLHASFCMAVYGHIDTAARQAAIGPSAEPTAFDHRPSANGCSVSRRLRLAVKPAAGVSIPLGFVKAAHRELLCCSPHSSATTSNGCPASQQFAWEGRTISLYLELLSNSRFLRVEHDKTIRIQRFGWPLLSNASARFVRSETCRDIQAKSQ